MTFEFHPSALEEYKEAALWYEEQRHRLGLQFTTAVETAVAAILNNPKRYPPAAEGTRVIRLTRFPYHLFFRVDEAAAHVRVLAVYHEKRRPGLWRGRA
jgi:toxin ParE1/3/4